MKPRRIRPSLVIFVLLNSAAGLVATAGAEDSPVASMVRSHCLDCHQGPEAEAGLDLASVSVSISDQNSDVWVKIHDRVSAGEMPPKGADQPGDRERAAFVETLRTELMQRLTQQHGEFGRVRGRRLTKVQLERTLHDLLGIDIPLATHMPEDARTAGFASVAAGQSMSHFQMQTHLSVIDRALDEAFRRATSAEPDEWSKEYTAQMVARDNPRRRCREPEMLKGSAVVWTGRTTFYGRMPATAARTDGWYRLTLKASALNPPKDHGVWCTVRTGLCSSSAPLMAWAGAFEATDKPEEWTFETWMPAGHMFEIRPGDETLKQARFSGGQIGTGEGEPQHVPGVAMHSARLEQIHRGPDNAWIRGVLFDEMTLQPGNKKGTSVKLVSTSPKKDLRRLLHRFAERAFRRPVTNEEIASYDAMVRESFESGVSALESLRMGYRAILCSPRFMYFHEDAGPLDDHAIACRMSYLLYSSMPDDELRQLADAGKLKDPAIRRRQVDRMLKDARGRRFVKDFAAEWLDLKDIDFTEPDRRLYPGFDVIVQESMLAETHHFLQTLLDENLSVANLIDADFTWLNSRLARYYGKPNVVGDELRRVSLADDDMQRGLLTQGAIMKVTANGTTTSPVIRGVWISERLLGVEIPPPPQGVPAIEPDIRGAKTIREMLAKHKSDTSCASCHVKIDPPGFAVENFDPSGRYRERYGTADRKQKTERPVVDASFDLPDGRHFDSLPEFQQLIVADPSALAANVARQLLTYGTGAVCGFADRDVVSEIVHSSADGGYGFRTVLQNVVSSETFLKK
ncbi:MAG: DUF1592 domain-containing protein [Planctomycetaceae bacterium]